MTQMRRKISVYQVCHFHDKLNNKNNLDYKIFHKKDSFEYNFTI